MPLIDRLREQWRLMRAERARGEESRRQVFAQLEEIKNNERKRIEDIRRIESQQAVEERRQQIQEQAYLLWKADGKPEGKDEYYWELAIEKIKGRNVPTVYKPYYLLERRILEPMDGWISRQAFFTIAAQLAILVAIIAFIGSENTRRNNEVFTAWQTITSAHEQPGSGGRIQALEFLNSRPLRFPWIGWTRDLFSDVKECRIKFIFGRRWKRKTLAGLSNPNAYLVEIYLCGADLRGANLQDANLGEANLQGADLRGANLQDTNLEGANLQGADLWRANLQDAYLGMANLQDVELNESNLQDASLWMANLQDANLMGANFQDAFLWGANLQGVNLMGANLQGVNLVGANLQDADLGLVNLQGVNLSGVNLQDASLWRANLQDANLGDASLTNKQIKSACFWEKAIYRGYWDVEMEARTPIQ